MKFAAVESRLPSREVTNDDVVARVRAASARHLPPDQLRVLEDLLQACFDSCGTRVRYHRDDGETALDLATEVGERALARAGLDPRDVDLLLYTGVCRGVLEPASAAIFQDRLGLTRATAFDVFDACASWLRALQLARTFIEHGPYRTIMVLNAEFGGRESHRYEVSSLEEFLHWHPSVTVGEAATATVLTAGDEDDQFETDFRTWGDRWGLCFVPLPNAPGYFGDHPTIDGVRPLQFVSHGVRLMEFATSRLIEHYQDLRQFDEFKPDLVFGHAASDGMSRYVLDACKIDPARYRFGHERHANTVSASIPLAMSEALRAGELSHGDRVVLLLASSGVTTALTKFVFHT